MMDKNDMKGTGLDGKMETMKKETVVNKLPRKCTPKDKGESKDMDQAPITQEWAKDAVQHALKEWFEKLQKSRESLSKSSKKEIEKMKRLYDWHEFLLNHLREAPISETETFVDWFIECYADPYKPAAKKFFVDNKKLGKIFRDGCKQNPRDMYPILRKVNEAMPVYDYPNLTFDSNTALYGCIVQKTPTERERRLPLSNDDVCSNLKMFLEAKDGERFVKWAVEVMQYNPLRVPSGLDFTETRESVKVWLKDCLADNNEARELFTCGMLECDQLQSLLDELQEQKEKASGIVDLKKENKNQESKNQSLQEEIEKLKKELEEKNSIIVQYVENQRRTKAENDSLDEQRKQVEQRLTLQILANERLVAENDRRLKKADEEIAQAVEDINQLENDNEELSNKLENVKADLALAKSRLKSAEESVGEQEIRTRKRLLKKLADNILEPLSYLGAIEDSLKNGHPDEESLTNFSEFLGEVEHALASAGLIKFGEIGQIESFDPALHELDNGICGRGDTVKVVGFGWKIKEEVYKKAVVQKGE